MSNKTLDVLFGSKVRVKILKSLFRNGDRNFSIRELAELTQVNPNTVKKEVRLLSDMGLLIRVDK